jgi:2-polyprenyl-3-methyl-5-hydroxy-6-metoxy-1,4-benzoquinol methylase
MSVSYNKYYQTENLFGDPYIELLALLSKYPKHEKVLDLGCGQGRDAIALARMGFDVTGIDNSSVGIAQMNQIAKTEQLQLNGIVADIFEFDNFTNYDFVLQDSLLHFTKKDLAKETEFIKRIISSVERNA